MRTDCDNRRMIALDILLADSRSASLPENLAAALSASSQARLAQISTEPRRQQFLLGRWLMAQAAECEAAQVEEGSAYPVYARQPNWQASISHSGPYVALVFSDQARFGLDIECPTRQRDWLALAERAFSANECAWIAAAAPEQRLARFQRIWTLREAAFKAGLLPHVVSTAALFDPNIGQVIGDFHWHYLQHGDLHLSVLGPRAFSVTVREVDLP